jgi:hypothetical protein
MGQKDLQLAFGAKKSDSVRKGDFWYSGDKETAMISAKIGKDAISVPVYRRMHLFFWCKLYAPATVGVRKRGNLRCGGQKFAS